MREMEKLLEKVSVDDVPAKDQTSVLEESSNSSTVKAEPQQQCTTDQASLVTFSRQKLALLQCEYDPKCCSGCKKPCTDMKRCVKCKTAYYCSKQCQAEDWGKRHKNHCKEIRRLEQNLRPRAVRENEWSLLQDLAYDPRMCMWGNTQIVTGSTPTRTTMASYNMQGQIKNTKFFSSSSIVYGPCVCYTDTGKYIAVAIQRCNEFSEPSDRYPDRIEMYTLDMKLHYRHTGSKSGCFGTLDYFDGIFLVYDKHFQILQFDVSSFPITPTGNPIPTGIKGIVRSMCSTFIKSIKAIILTYEDEEGYYTMTCINYNGDRLWQLGGILAGIKVDNTAYLSHDDLRFLVKLWHRGGLEDRFLPDDVCVDDRGYIFAANPISFQVVVVKEDRIPKAIFQAPGRVWCVKWCEMNKKLYVIHINETRTSLMTAVLNVSEI